MVESLNIFPETLVKESMSKALSHVRESTTDYLAVLLNGMQWEGYDFYEQARQLLIAESGGRKLTMGFRYDAQQTPSPALIIATETEEPASTNEWLALGQGFVTADDLVLGDGESTYFTRRKKATMSLTILSDNPAEAAMLYTTITGLLLSVQLHLHLSGLEQLTIGGGSSERYEALLPAITNRVILLNFEYNYSAPSIPAGLQ
ncbi:hypothetical protein SAMN05444266_102222 [Chitinophaga jiangningensis]|uniref:Uncharacterized protein n=1 Tax=Chitinophaga jiangningensis TaxID=1419482 RepID=A0A1M6YA77_9BACT|nr:hypothetical protein [Chitinophaga jiangningensis]SHL15108.1 hypothetical protein SAMN05444266_102222 [Chitinophaga jiangningensis]